MALIFNERFENTGTPGYDETSTGAAGNWSEILGSGGSPAIDENFDTDSVPGGKPPTWGEECLKIVCGTSTSTTTSNEWNSAKGTLYTRFDVVFGSFGDLTNDNSHIVRHVSASNYPWSIDLNNTGGKTYLRCWYNNGSDWQGPLGNLELALNTKYRIDIKWVKNTASNGIEFKVDGSSLGTGTSGNLDLTTFIFGDVGGALKAFNFYFDNIQFATDGWVPEDATGISIPVISESLAFAEALD